MLRIERSEGSHHTATLKLDGWVIGPWVQELSRSCEQVLATGAKLVLDFSDVSFLDRPGIALVQNLAARSVTFVNCSPFVLEQLKVEQP